MFEASWAATRINTYPWRMEADFINTYGWLCVWSSANRLAKHLSWVLLHPGIVWIQLFLKHITSNNYFEPMLPKLFLQRPQFVPLRR